MDNRETLQRHTEAKAKNGHGEEERGVNDFSRQLNTKFDWFTENVLPIEGEFSADPKDVLKLPTKQRGEALAEFKDKLVRQRKAMAECRLYIERSINFDNDISEDFLVDIVSWFANEYAFSDDQRTAVEFAVHQYYVMRKRAQDFREQFPNNIELVNKLTGLTFDNPDEFKIEPDFMCLKIETGGENLIKMYRGDMMATETPTDFRLNGFASAGRFSGSDGPTPFVAIRSDVDTHDDHGVRDHEYEHIKHQVFDVIFRFYFKGEYYSLFGHSYFDNPGTVKSFAEEFKKQKSSESLEAALSYLEPFFKGTQLYALEQARGEIFAMLKNHPLDSFEIASRFLRWEDPSSYDYLADTRRLLWEEFKGEKEVQGLMERYFIHEYADIINDALHMLDLLVSSFTLERGYSDMDGLISEATALLTDVPLQNWRIEIKRFFAQKYRL